MIIVPQLECVAVFLNHCEDFKYISVLTHHCFWFFLHLGHQNTILIPDLNYQWVLSVLFVDFFISLVKYNIFNNLSGLG